MRRLLAIFLIALLAAATLSLATVASKRSAPPEKRCGRAANSGRDARAERSWSLDELYMVEGPIPIPDNPGNNTNDTAISVLTIPDDVTINDLNVRIVISHSWVRDLYISLSRSVDTAQVVLLNLLPQDGADTLDGWFDDEAPLSILDTAATLVGEWRPVETLSDFDGQSAQGDWILRVWDRFRLDSGYVARWGLDVNPTYNLEGTVTNGFTRTPVRNARVDVEGTGQFVGTNSRGEYAFLSLPSGTYTILFSKARYETLSVANVVIEEGLTTPLDAIMQTEPGYYEYASRGDAVQIPDSGGGSGIMTLSVRGSESVIVTSLDITVNISHTFTGDLELYLVSPAEDTVLLADSAGSSYGDGFVECRFSDDSDSLISSYSPPFTGRFRPEEPLSEVDSIATIGNWSLMAIDSASQDVGTIENFTLHVTSTPLSVPPPTLASLPDQWIFHGNYPNPFNAETRFSFDLAKPARVRLVLYDVLGRQAADIANDAFAAGSHEIMLDARGLASGIYIARFSAGDFAQSHKMMLLK